jgi:hypothetical protein
VSGIAVGEGLEGNEALEGEFNFNEDGTCINESKESLVGAGDGVGVGEVACSCAGRGCGFVAVASVLVEGALGRCSEMSLCFVFFGSAAADASSNLPCTIIPDSRLETV